MVFLLLLLVTNLSLGANLTSYKKNNRGQKALLNKNHDKALEYFTEAWEQEPKNQKILYNLGNVFYKTQDYDKAVSLYQKSLEKNVISTEKAAMYYNLGNSYYQKNNWEKARKMYEKTLHLYPDDIAAKINLELSLKKEKENPQKSDNKQKKEKQEQKKEKQKTETKDTEKEYARRALKALAKKEQKTRKKYLNKQIKNENAREYDW